MKRRENHTGDLVRAGQLPLLQELAAAEVKDKPQTPAAKKRKASSPAIPADPDLIRPEDIAYTHSLFLQCFMPVRHNKKNHYLWETGNRQAKLVIRSGLLIKPDDPGQLQHCIVPAGPKARLIVAYINDYAYRHKSQEIDLGANLHQAMKQMNVPIGGKNRKELVREVENVAAAEILMGLWMADGSAHQKTAKVADDVSFWIEKNPDQRTIWQPTMTISQRYYESIHQSQHMAPIYWPAFVALQHNARAMDVFVWLCYRLRTIQPKRPILISADALHGMFGRDIKHRYHFWPHFLNALHEALAQYPDAQNSVQTLDDNSGIRFGYAPPLIPHRKIGRIT